MAGGAFGAAREMPLSLATIHRDGGIDRGTGEELRIGAFLVPAIGEAIPDEIVAVDKETRLEATAGIFKMLDQHRADGEGPVAVFGIGDAFGIGVRGAVVGDGDPAFLVRAVRPERLVDPVGHHAGGGGEGVEIRERRRLRKEAGRLGDAFGGFFDAVDSSAVEIGSGEAQHVEFS